MLWLVIELFYPLNMHFSYQDLETIHNQMWESEIHFFECSTYKREVGEFLICLEPRANLKAPVKWLCKL